LKVAFVDEDLSPRTGSRRFTIEVCSQLQRCGHTVDIFTTRLDKKKCFQEYLSLPVHVFSEQKSEIGTHVGSLKHLAKPLNSNSLAKVANDVAYYSSRMRLAMKISQEIADMQCDVAMIQYHGEHWLLPYFFHLEWPKGVAYMNVIPPFARPWALPFQELQIPRRVVDKLLGLPPYGRWRKVSFGNLALVLTPSKYLLEHAESRNLIGHRKKEIVSLGVDHSRFFPTGEEEPFALYLGRIHPHKSLELAVAAMENSKPGMSLVIAGDIDNQHLWYKEKLVRLAERLHLSDRFDLMLSPTDSQCVELMQKCSVFLFPSTIDTFGLVALEAMACGKPVVANNRGGVPEIVANAGFLLEPNVQQWQLTVERLLSDSRLRRRMGEKALERSHSFSWGKTADRLLSAFSLINEQYVD